MKADFMLQGRQQYPTYPYGSKISRDTPYVTPANSSLNLEMFDHCLIISGKNKKLDKLETNYDISQPSVRFCFVLWAKAL